MAEDDCKNHRGALVCDMAISRQESRAQIGKYYAVADNYLWGGSWF